VKTPRSIDFIDIMPRGDNGKLYKKKLRDPYWTDSARLASGINPTKQNGGVS
jgi:acyl-coenzyme A synthetase/AMP-(fatty) acid ligase